jgi:hypothetical protein
MFAVIYLNEFAWPELIGVYGNYEEAKDTVMAMIASDGRDLVTHRPCADWDARHRVGYGEGHRVAAIAQEQFGTGTESPHSYLIQKVPA